MIILESALRNSQAQTVTVIDADPAALRECADRIEAMSRSAHPGQSVLCPLTPSITIIFRPESHEFRNRIQTPEVCGNA